MAYTITIYDPITDTTYDVTSRTLKIATAETLDNETTTFTVSCKEIYEVHEFHNITVKKDEVVILDGRIIEQNDFDAKYKATTFECVSWEVVLQKRIIANTYLSTDQFGGRPDLIIKDILSKKCLEFTTNNIKVCSSLIDRIGFSYIPVEHAIKNIIEMLQDWHWYVDANKDFHFFQYYEAVGPTFSIANRNININTLNVKYSGYEHFNRVWIVGRKQASPKYVDDYFQADGKKRHFPLSYEPNETEVYLNDELMGSALEGNDNENRDFLINKSQKVVYIPDYRTPYTGTVKVRYKPTKQFIDYYENGKDIEDYGLMEKAIKYADVVDKLEARQFGSAEVKKTSVIQRKISFTTQTAIKVAQKCHVDITPDGVINKYWDVVGDFVVTSVKRDITPQIDLYTVDMEELL